MVVIKTEPTKAETEFGKALYESKGKANNELIYKLITEYGCTADDIAKVAQNTSNENFLDNRTHISDYTKARMINKNAHKNKQWKYFRDYEWFFKYLPEKYKDYVLFDALNRLFDRDVEYLDDRELGLYSLNYYATLLNRDAYPTELFAERFKNSPLYDLVTRPYRLKEVAFHEYNGTFYPFEYGSRWRKILDTYFNDYLRYDYDRTDGSTRIQRKTQLKVLEQCVQVDLLSLTMLNEIYDDFYDKDHRIWNNEGNEIYTYSDYLFSRYRKTGTRKVSHPQILRLEMFAQEKALEMLLGMGLGFKVNTNCSYNFKYSNKKLNKRIQTAYKTFIKAKTVDERKSMRELLKEQLAIISNDFMGNNLEVVELKCVSEQDKMFEQNISQKTVSVPKTRSSRTTSNVTYVRKTIDLSKLASAQTTQLTSGRN